MTVFADDRADGVNEGKERARFVRRRGEEDLQSCLAHELERTRSAGFLEPLLASQFFQSALVSGIVEGTRMFEHREEFHVEFISNCVDRLVA